jgi:flagellar hook-associated protein 2
MADITSSGSASSIATQFATAYTAGTQNQINTRNQSLQATTTALTKLKSLLNAFNSALGSLSSGSKLAQFSTSFSVTGFATATASSTAQSGSYSLFVQQVATAHQLAFSDLPAVPVAMGGPIVVQLADGTNFPVNLQLADQNNDGVISQIEIARAINQANGNAGKVMATTVTVGSTTQLVLTAGHTGANSQITVDASQLPASTLQTALSSGTSLVAANDAIAVVNGVTAQQASNIFTGIAGVSVAFTKAQAPGDTPITLTVSSDASGTSANVRKFIDAYNALEKGLDDLAGKGADDTPNATFASDSGVRSLRDRLSNALHGTYGGFRLADLGISADRYGTVSLDDTKLQRKLATSPDALTQVFGSTGLTTASGALGALQTVVNSWTDSTKGQIKHRMYGVQVQQKDMETRQVRLDRQYAQAYNRYLAQFTQLQALQSQMDNTTASFAKLGA